MKAVVYGAGNIGRGFIGPLLYEAGYEVVFIDVNTQIVNEINLRGSYPLRILGSKGTENILIKNVSAVNGSDEKAAIKVIENADIMATAVGAGILNLIAPNIAYGIRNRLQKSVRTLDIILCENLMHADTILCDLVKEYLTFEEKKQVDQYVGFVEASIGRMVPVMTEEQKKEDPLLVCVESYPYLPVDKDAFRGDVPSIRTLVPYSPFLFYIQRKLFVHNLGHAICAYLGIQRGYTYVYEAVEDPEICFFAENAMLESAAALSKEYGISFDSLFLHIRNLLIRFRNEKLKDTCVRVARDAKRKLQPEDRLVGAASFCCSLEILPAYICIGIAAAVYQYIREEEQEASVVLAEEVLKYICGIGTENELQKYILSLFNEIMEHRDLSGLRRSAEKFIEEKEINIV